MPTIKNSYLLKSSKRLYPGYYINRFMGMRCAADMLHRQLFPNAKEITESFAAFEATLNNTPLDFGDKVTAVCVGDGTKPRTAAMFCFRSAWNAVSIDPSLRLKSYNINRLSLIRDKIENVSLTYDHPVVIVQPHSHAKLEDCLQTIKAPVRHAVCIPCCVPQYVRNRSPDLEYQDENIWSPCNTVKVFLNL